MLEIRTRYGRNAVVKGINMLEGATTIERNSQIGGHKSGELGMLPAEIAAREAAKNSKIH